MLVCVVLSLLTTTLGRWAVVTGASSGIGEALARKAASEGYDVILAARRRQRLDALSKELQSGDTAVAVVQCDLGTASGIDALCKATAKYDLGLVCLNAGICEKADSVTSQSEEAIDRQLELNVRANTKLFKHFANTMAEAGNGGNILLIASSAGAAPGVPGVSVYAASKAYLRSLAAGVGAELRKQRTNVRVTCALPSAVDSEFAQRSGLSNAAIFSLPGVRRVGGIVMSAEAVASCAYKAALNGRAEIVPGLLPRLYVGLTDRRLLPRPLARGIAAFSFAESPAKRLRGGFAGAACVVARRHTQQVRSSVAVFMDGGGDGMEQRRGKRIGGRVEKAVDTTNDNDDGSPLSSLALPGAALLALLLLKSLLFPANTFTYSVSSYSQTTVVRDDGSGKPKYETKRESSFKTNVPGLAERLAEEGKAPEEMLAVPLFPF